MRASNALVACLASTIASVDGARLQRSAPASLLEPISTSRPDTTLFPPSKRYPLAPANTEIAGPKHTNKFWGNWVVEDGSWDMSIYPAPYTVRFKEVGNSPSGALSVAHQGPSYGGGDTITFYTSHWIPDFHLGAVEAFEGLHTIVKEEHFGVHAQVRGPGGRKMTFPVYAGMAYVSGRYEGGCTPLISTNYVLRSLEKVRDGVWRFVNSYQAGREYRVYVLTAEGKLVDSSFDFDMNGQLNRQLDGWVRVAHVQAPSDTAVLDAHAETVLVGWGLSVSEGTVEYDFQTVKGSGAELLHFAYANHMDFLAGGAKVATNLLKSTSTVKGDMTPLVGDTWQMQVDISEALALGTMPAQEPKAEYQEDIKKALMTDWEDLKVNWRMSMFKRDHYFSGKGFQKTAMVCLMLSKFYGKDHAETQACADVLKSGFRCMYDRSVSDGSDRKLEIDGEWVQNEGCWWAPFGSWYDESWGGIPSRWSDSPTCGLDFGNGCYNDHHYHWAYYVVSAAMLVELSPAMKDNTAFVDLVNMFIRDVSNPSTSDPYFPQFRTFDWFDMHSWSRGLKRNYDGKDQESTSEEVNLHYGLLLWGRAIGNSKMEKLGATMLTVASRSLQEYFLMRRDNPNHNPNFAKNHVTGIFFQNKVHITTWFGPDNKYVHGIQMLPLTAALPLSRTVDFCLEEWYDNLEKEAMDTTDAWTSILASGNLAFHNPEAAWEKLTQMNRKDYDDGLMKSWALYWTSIQTKAEGGPGPTEAPITTTTAAAGGGSPGGIFCNPDPSLDQRCPGGIPCPQCGAGACECP